MKILRGTSLMSIARLVRLNVVDQELYRQYRIAMLPILHQYAGEFEYDFVIDKTLKSPSDIPCNRLFIIRFPNTAAQTGFFGDKNYQEIRKQFYDPAVSHAEIVEFD